MRINILLPSKGAELLELIWLPGFVLGYCPKSDGTGSGDITQIRFIVSHWKNTK